METRMIKKLGIQTSLLGLGGMRLPLTEDGKIERQQTGEMIDLLYRAGVNYYDTAYPYHNGESEVVFGELLKRYPRDSFYVADKMPMWVIEEPADMQRIFNIQLERLQMDRIDFYLLHALNAARWKKVKELGAYEFQQSLKAQGKIRFAGFSFHDKAEVLEDILKDQPEWDFVQIQLNYVDWTAQNARKQYELLCSYGIPVIIMEPVRGGILCNLPNDAAAVLQGGCPGKSQANIAYRWAGGIENAAVILSGVSNLEQTRENIGIFSDFQPLSSDEYAAVDEMLEVLSRRPMIPCTACNYCIDCPVGINIPRIFNIYNEQIQFDCSGSTNWRYYIDTPEDKRANQCIECGACVEQCPQQIAIPARLKEAESLIEKVTASFRNA